MMTLFTGKKFQAWNRVEHVIFGQKDPKLPKWPKFPDFDISRTTGGTKLIHTSFELWNPISYKCLIYCIPFRPTEMAKLGNLGQN